MNYHFNVGLKNCTGDFAFKVDSDYVYHEKNFNVKEFRNMLWNIKDKYNIVYLRRVNYLPNNYFSVYPTGSYGINTYLLKKLGKNYKIGLKNYVNSAELEMVHKEYLSDFEVNNYDYTFMTADMMYEKTFRWYYSYLTYFKNLDRLIKYGYIMINMKL